MGRYPQKSDGKGSLKCTQKLINNNDSFLNNKIRGKLAAGKTFDIDWLSPLAEDDYAEYRDAAFIKRLGIDKLEVSLNEFWPRMGPQWDALGKSNNDIILLVESKANIPEIISSPTGAAAEKSIKKINNSLKETKKYINAVKKENNVDWSGYFYQYTNRIAHLYFLRVLNNISTYLINIYFINDKSVNGPKNKEEWLGAIKVVKNYLGIKKNHKLSDYMIDLFIDLEEI